MLPGSLVPPPPPLVLIGYPSVPSVSTSATPSSSTGSSIAIIAVVVIASTILTCAIVVLRRSSRRRCLSCSSFSRRCSFSPTASSPAESEMQCAVAAAVGPRASASAPKDAEGPASGLEAPVPSAPSLPEVERVILDLLSQPPVPVHPGSSMFCCICTQDFVPTDMILALPVCSHKFHQSCIITCLRRPTPSRCPFCYASITIPDKNGLDPAFSSDEYDIEAQMRLAVPAPPGEEVAEAAGGSRGWLRSSLDRLSGSWRGCSSNRATAAVAPVSSQHPTGSWRLDTVQSAEEAEAVGSSRGWLRSYLATLSGTWSGCSDSHSTAMVLPVSSRCATGSLSMGSSGRNSTDSWSRSWDPEAAVQRKSVFNNGWLLRN